jgi:dynein intermediate chain 2, axonemal
MIFLIFYFWFIFLFLVQDPRFAGAANRMPVASYVWDVMNPNAPDVELIPPSPLCCLRFNPKSTDTLVSFC